MRPAGPRSAGFPPTADRLESAKPLVWFDCQCYAVPDTPRGGSAYIRSLLWISRIATDDPGTAGDWFLDRLDLLSVLLEGEDIGRAAQWLDTPDARWRAEATLRDRQRIDFALTDIDRVRYDLLVEPVFQQARRPARGGARAFPRRSGRPEHPGTAHCSRLTTGFRLLAPSAGGTPT